MRISNNPQINADGMNTDRDRDTDRDRQRLSTIHPFALLLDLEKR